MIKLHHNFDETKFKWLWAKYVCAGNIAKHCTASMIGPYSKKFSGTSNKNLLGQPILVMDEQSDGSYQAIYFCGVLKQGYLNNNIEKNNYQHNVHFAVRPQQGAHDVWDFENWHVEIEDGVLEHIPATYELGDRFFREPYNAHYYTCRIFRWMVGHFYPQELRDTSFGLPETLVNPADGKQYLSKDVVANFIKDGYDTAKKLFYDGEEDSDTGFWKCLASKLSDEALTRKQILSRQMFNRKEFLELIHPFDAELQTNEVKLSDTDGNENVVNLYDFVNSVDNSEIFNNLYRIGLNEFLDMVAPYQERNT